MLSVRSFSWLGKLTSVFLLVVLLISGCGKKGSSQENAKAGSGGQATYVFKVGHSQPENHPFQIGLKKFAELVQEKSKGQIKIEVYPGGVLGGTRDRTEGVRVGTADMELVGSPDLSRWVSQAYLFDLPFLIKDYKQADAIMDGPVGETIKKAAEEKGFKLLAYGENGFRHVFNKYRPINTLEDLKGLKLRVYPNQVYTETFKALGALPMTTDWGELYTALAQGAVDGAEAAEAHFMAAKFYEAGQKYFSLTKHTYIPAVLIMNKAKFDKLPPELQKVMQESAQEAMKYQREVARKQAEEYRKTMGEKYGVKVNEVKDLSKFIEAVKSIYDAWVPKIGKDLVEAAQKAS